MPAATSQTPATANQESSAKKALDGANDLYEKLQELLK